MAFTRLGLETANVPHADRYGLLWLERGSLFVEKGTLRFACAGSPNLAPGAYDIPYQTVSMILLGPGTTVSHDVFRLVASHGMGLIAVGTGGVRMYTAPPLSPDRSALARRQVECWSSPVKRREIVLKMYELRFGEQLPTSDIEELQRLNGPRGNEAGTVVKSKGCFSPAHAGMNPRARNNRRGGRSKPRTRGDGPSPLMYWPLPSFKTPHTRG
ncbi:MAG: hypothetical protein J6H20_01125 [Pyramidobacter sp.]|nr:hypothetical protein [Pyramidobacter sp.]